MTLFIVYFRENKHKSKYFIEKRLSVYLREQQRYQDAQRWIMKKKTSYRSRNSNVQRKPNGRKNHIIGWNLKEQY